jgi:hypothetical protein
VPIPVTMHTCTAIALGLASLSLFTSVASAQTAPGDVVVTPVTSAAVGTSSLPSSTRLTVAWTRAERAHHLEVVARESIQGTEVRARLAAEATTVTLTNLKAATPYAITVIACQDEGCA